MTRGHPIPLKTLGYSPMTVFISYSHDSKEHGDGVLALANRLVKQGVDAILDQYQEASPPEGWPRWMERGIRNSDFVLMVCSGPYYRRVMGEEEPDTGLGVKWEGHLIYQHLYDAETMNLKFVPILLKGARTDQIPDPLRGATYYRVNTERGYEDLYRLLTGQPRVRKPKLGQRSELSTEGPGEELPYSLVSDATGLAVRFSRRPPYRLTVVNHEDYRLGVYNHGPDPATNVKVWLDDITPLPRDARFDTYRDFPYSRQPVDEGTDDRTINPKDEMLFQIVSWWVGGSGPQHRLQIGDVMVDNLGPTSFLVEPDEQWKLHLRISSGNYEQIKAILAMQVEDGEVNLYLDESLQQPAAPEHPSTRIAPAITPPRPSLDPRFVGPTEEFSLSEITQRATLELKDNIGLRGWSIGDVATDWLDILHDHIEYIQFPTELQQAIGTVMSRTRALKSMPRNSATKHHANYAQDAENLIALLNRFGRRLRVDTEKQSIPDLEVECIELRGFGGRQGLSNWDAILTFRSNMRMQLGAIDWLWYVELGGHAEGFARHAATCLPTDYIEGVESHKVTFALREFEGEHRTRFRILAHGQYWYSDDLNMGQSST